MAHADMLAPAPPAAVTRVVGLGESITAASLLTLYLQAFDNQPGISIPFKDLDYARVVQWLDAIVTLDPRSQYPDLLASHLYAQVPDPARARIMMSFVHRQFLHDPERRWRWLAHVTIMAKHRLQDSELALRYAKDIALHAKSAPNWARQMHIFILEDLGEFESAKILLGGLLDSGEVKDSHEMRFLIQRLNEMKTVENPPSPTKN